MSKEIDLIKCIISEIDNNLYSDFGGNPCISYTSDLKKLLLALDTPEVRHFFENYNKQDQRIAELEEQLKNLNEKYVSMINENVIAFDKLEKELANAIVPKFKSRDVAYRINCFTKDIEQVVIVNTHIEIICGINITYTIACLGENQTLANIDIRNIIEYFGTYISQEREEDLFTTKEEAQAKLEELKGE